MYDVLINGYNKYTIGKIHTLFEFVLNELSKSMDSKNLGHCDLCGVKVPKDFLVEALTEDFNITPYNNTPLTNKLWRRIFKK